MYFNRSPANYEFVAIMSSTKLIIYELCEDDTLGVEKNLLFEIDFINNDEYKKFGNPICADFDDAGAFITVSTT